MLELSSLLVALCLAAPFDSQPMPQVDLNRYMGRWYEVARFPHRFEKDCHGVTADYALRPDGKVSVLNTCRKGALDGPVKTAKATGWSAHPSNSRLRVRFFWPFSAAYWIVALDSEYRWAVVGHPSRKYLWLLSRTPGLPAEVDAVLVAEAARLGYDVSKLERPQQPATGAWP